MPQPRPHEELDTPRYRHVHGDLGAGCPAPVRWCCSTWAHRAPQRWSQRGGTVEVRISLRRCSSCAETGTTTMRPLRPAWHSGAPRLQAMPSAVSRSDSAQMSASSGQLALEQFAQIRRQGSPDGAVGAKHRQPQVTGSACTWLIKLCSPSVLPDMVPVTAHSMLPRRHIGHDLGKAGEQGSAPGALTKSAWVDDDTAPAARQIGQAARGLPQRSPAPDTHRWPGLHPCWSRSAFSRYGRKAASVVRKGGNVGVQPRQIGAVYSGCWAEKELISAVPNGTTPNCSSRSISVPGTGPVEEERFLRCNARRSGAPVRGPRRALRGAHTGWFGQTAHHTQVGYRGRGWGRRLRPGKGCRPPEHAAAQRSSAAAKQSRQTRNNQHGCQTSPVSLCSSHWKAEEHHPCGPQAGMRHCAYATPVFTEKSNAWKQLIDVDQDCMHGQRRQRGFWPDEGGPTKCAGRTAPKPVSPFQLHARKRTTVSQHVLAGDVSAMHATGKRKWRRTLRRS